jgi:hypothetical protein
VKEKQCSACEWYSSRDSAYKHGYCLLNPPVPLSHDGRIIAVYPRVLPIARCASFTKVYST